MKCFVGRDINSVYLDTLLYLLQSNAAPVSSRCGDIIDLGPAFFEFTYPTNQLVLLNKRKFNPYFAVVESAWVLSGRNNLSDLQQVIKNYGQFSDNGISLNGAYGYRMQVYFELNQLELAIKLLKDKPETRRCVITLYAPRDLINNSSLDVPCNTTVYLKIRNSNLDLTVVNRSNDIYLGLPYNVFVFNVIQNYISHQLGLKIGVQRHFTDSLHLYVKDLSMVKKIVSCNSLSEIKKWCDELTDTNNLIEGIIESFNEIATLDADSISNSYCRNVIMDYLRYRAVGDKSSLRGNLPNDIFGLSVELWLNSLS